MICRELESTETELLVEAAGFERAFPTFYRDALNTRTAKTEDMLRFYSSCARLFGLFSTTDNNLQLIGLAYFQQITPEVYEVHFEMRRGAARADELVPLIAEIRDRMFACGMRMCMAWTFKRNKPIQTMLKGIGFRHSGLRMRLGQSRGRVLEWEQMTIRRMER
jgi:RimJ/RimL family protein N-acetyltransferase